MSNDVEVLKGIYYATGGVDTATGEYINKFGEQNDVDQADATAGQVIWEVKATVQQYLFLDAPIQLSLASSSAEDGVAGSGALTVDVIFHDSTGQEQTESIIMNGVAEVDLSDTSYGVFRMEVNTSGSTNSNVGTISVVDGSANIYATIEPVEGKTLIAVQRIPNGKTAIVKCVEAKYSRASPATNAAVMRLKVRKANGTETTELNAEISNISPTFEKEYKIGGIRVEGGEWVYWKCISTSADNTPIAGYIDLMFVE